MAGAVVGIDLGTTNTVVAVVRGGKALVLADENGARLLPSVVSFHPNGEVLVGQKARERRLVDARNTIYSIKRLIGRSWSSDEVGRARQRFPFELREGPTHGPLVVARNETYTLPEISAFVLRRAKAIAEKALGEPVERAVVTVPASFNDLQRASTKVAAREAGLEVLRILNEPTAAALAYGFGKSGSERIAVYDFGGGTFDLTLLDLSGNVFEVIATAGDSFLGGDDVDQAIADRIAQTLVQTTRFDPRGDVQIMERLRAGAESIKISLSSQQDISVEFKEVGYGAGGKPIDMKFTMTRTELEQLATPLVDRTFNVCTEALQLARLKNDAFDNIILVGGSTRIPLARRKVEMFFGKKPLDRVNPDEVVAIGAAIQAAALTGAERRRQSTPAPILNTDAVKQSRIQTLGGVGKHGQKGAPVAPPPRTTGRIVGQPLEEARAAAASETATLQQPVPRVPGKTPVEIATISGDGIDSEEPTLNRRVDDMKFEDEEEVTVARQVPQFPAAGPPGVPNTRPPPPVAPPADANAYPDIPGAVNVRQTGSQAGQPLPGRPVVTAPLVPQMSRPLPPQRDTGRMLATPPPTPAIMNEFGGADITGSGPQQMPRGFPDHSPEPIALQQLTPPQHAPMPQMPPMPPPGIDQTPPPQRRPLPLQQTQLQTEQPQMRTQVSPMQQTQMQMQPPTGFGTNPALGRIASNPALGHIASNPALGRVQSVPPLPGAGNTEGSVSRAFPSAWPPAGAANMPLLIDVTPLTLSVETVSGWVDKVIARNTPVPCSQTRQFTTSADYQELVVIRVCQGEGEQFPQNTALGQLELTGLRRARRGDVRIEVTFELDADGILQVRARDVETGRQTGAQMRLVGLDQPRAAQPSMQAPSI
jgi:molecular chaperone DnaK